MLIHLNIVSISTSSESSRVVSTQFFHCVVDSSTSGWLPEMGFRGHWKLPHRYLSLFAGTSPKYPNPLVSPVLYCSELKFYDWYQARRYGGAGGGIAP